MSIGSAVRAAGVFALALGLVLPPVEDADAASGSWVATLSRQRVAASDDPLRDRPLETPGHIRQGRITTVHWSFATQGGDVPIEAWLCQASLCVALPAASGSTSRFQGRPVTGELRFRFWYPASKGASGSVAVSRARVIVDYDA